MRHRAVTLLDLHANSGMAASRLGPNERVGRLKRCIALDFKLLITWTREASPFGRWISDDFLEVRPIGGMRGWIEMETTVSGSMNEDIGEEETSASRKSISLVGRVDFQDDEFLCQIFVLEEDWGMAMDSKIVSSRYCDSYV